MGGYDPSEAQKDRTFDKVRWTRGVVISGLEDATGADLVVTGTTGLPIKTVTLVKEHLLAGWAQLVQFKNGGDLAGSVGSHMNDQLMRMLAFLAEIGIPKERRQSMACLLTSGYYLPYDDGLVGDADTLYTGEARPSKTGRGPYFYGEEYTRSHTGYRAVESAQNSWVRRGGSLLATCPRLTMLPDYLDRLEAGLAACAAMPIKVVAPDKPRPQIEQEIAPGLQLLVSPPDIVAWFAGMRGIGIGLAQVIAEFYITNHAANGLPAGLDGYDILWYLIDVTKPHPKGWANGRIKALAKCMAFNYDKRTAELLEQEEVITQC